MQAGLARDHTQITIGGSNEIKSPILSIDQHGGWCIRLEQQALRKFAEIWALRFKLSDHPWPKRAGGLADVRGNDVTLPLVAANATKGSHRARYRLEKVGALADGFRGAQKQDPALIQRTMEQRKDLFLFFWLQIDQQIAAGYEIQARERRIGQQILNRKDYRISQVTAHAVAMVLVRKEARKPLRRDLVLDQLWIDGIAPVGHGLRAHVGREYLKLRVLFRRSEFLYEEHSQGIGLLTRAATRNPDADRPIHLMFPHQVGNDRLRQRLESGRIAKEAGHMDQQVLRQQLEFRAILAQSLEVVVNRPDPCKGHPAPDAAQQCGFLVVGEILRCA